MCPISCTNVSTSTKPAERHRFSWGVICLPLSLLASARHLTTVDLFPSLPRRKSCCRIPPAVLRHPPPGDVTCRLSVSDAGTPVTCHTTAWGLALKAAGHVVRHNTLQPLARSAVGPHLRSLLLLRLPFLLWLLHLRSHCRWRWRRRQRRRRGGHLPARLTVSGRLR